MQGKYSLPEGACIPGEQFSVVVVVDSGPGVSAVDTIPGNNILKKQVLCSKGEQYLSVWWQ